MYTEHITALLSHQGNRVITANTGNKLTHSVAKPHCTCQSFHIVCIKVQSTWTGGLQDQMCSAGTQICLSRTHLKSAASKCLSSLFLLHSSKQSRRQKQSKKQHFYVITSLFGSALTGDSHSQPLPITSNHWPQQENPSPERKELKYYHPDI